MNLKPSCYFKRAAPWRLPNAKSILQIAVFVVLSYAGKAQPDTIKIDAPVYTVSDKELTAAQVKKGDTIMAFKLAEDVTINNSKYQNFVVAKRGAQVIAVIESSLLPYKLKRGPPPPLMEIDRDPSWTPSKELKIGGEISLRFLFVEVLDGTFVPLNDCLLLVTGGQAGEKGNLKAVATIPPGSRKSCSTKLPEAVLIINKHD